MPQPWGVRIYFPNFHIVKRLYAFILLLLLSFRVGAQCPNSFHMLDVAVSYGSISPGQVKLGVQAENKKINSISGATFVSVRYFLYAYLSLGFTGGSISEQGQYSTSYSATTIKSTYTQTSTTIAPELYYVYTYKRYFEAYTLLGAGVAFTKVTTTTRATPYTPESTAATAYEGVKMQYTPIGIRVGGHLSAFAELGFGYKGLLNAGVSWKFGRPCWWKQQ